MSFKKILILLFLSLNSINLRANFIENFFSPFYTQAVLITLAGGGATYFAYQERDEHTDKYQNDISNDKPMKRYSHYGDLLGQLAPNVVFTLSEWAFGSNARALHMYDATSNAGLLTLILKYTVRETRPDNSDRLSFPSGHSATAFAFASVVGIHYPWYVGLPAYIMAAAVGFSRVNDKKHHIHDVLAGLTIGMAYGYGTYYVNQSDYGSASSAFRFFPWYGPEGDMQLVVQYDF